MLDTDKNSNFIKSCKRLDIETTTIKTTVTTDVYYELKRLSEAENCTVSQFLRDMIDYFLTSEYTD